MRIIGVSLKLEFQYFFLLFIDGLFNGQKLLNLFEFFLIFIFLLQAGLPPVKI